MTPDARADATAGDPFDIDDFLQRPLVAHIATDGPTVRPVWYSWHDGALWCAIASDSVLGRRLANGSRRVSVVIDVHDATTGEALKVSMRGDAELLPGDPELTTRIFRRYLGPDGSTWEQQFTEALHHPTAVTLRLDPTRTTLEDHRFVPSLGRRCEARHD